MESSFVDILFIAADFTKQKLYSKEISQRDIEDTDFKKSREEDLATGCVNWKYLVKAGERKESDKRLKRKEQMISPTFPNYHGRKR